jgi:benzoyl-CoA reductase/2-hydroxyglutaryl-CoA dehydratase subunit BcrC/BadD/HgdB
VSVVDYSRETHSDSSGGPRKDNSPLAPFFEAAREIGESHWPRALVESGKPTVAVLCNLAPLELIHAAGAVPVRLCAGSTADPRLNATNAESKIQNLKSKILEAPRDLCQVVKGAAARLDALKKMTGRALAAVIVPATCDWKTHCCGFLGLGDEARVLAVPREKSSLRARREWRRQIADLADFLAQRTGVPITRESLLWSVTLYQQASRLGRRLADLMKPPVPPIPGADLMLVFNLYYSLPVETWIEAAAPLLSEIRHKLSANEEYSLTSRATARPRLLLVGAPIIWPHWELPRLIESLGGTIVADALCSSYRGFGDLVSVDETTRPALIEALADRYLLPSTCPCFAPNEEYLWRVENQLDDFRVEGAIIHRLKNCYLYDMEAKRLEDTFRSRDLPCLQVETDYESPAPAALTTRVEAFLDLLRQRRS